MKIFRHRLLHKIPAGERVEADDGYRGAPDKVRTAGMVVSQADKRAKDRARKHHETVNSCFKNWGCMAQVFRHGQDRHGEHFGAVAVCTQIALEQGEPLFDTTY